MGNKWKNKIRWRDKRNWSASIFSVSASPLISAGGMRKDQGERGEGGNAEKGIMDGGKEKWGEGERGMKRRG